MLKAVIPRIHAVRVDTAAWAAIFQPSKSQEAATRKRAALCFHPAVRFFAYTSGQIRRRRLHQARSTRRRFTETLYKFANQQAFAAANTLDRTFLWKHSAVTDRRYRMT
jgi:hypothetical protein